MLKRTVGVGIGGGILAVSLLFTALADPGARAETPSAAAAKPTGSEQSTVVPGLSTSTLEVPDLGGGAHRIRIGVLEPKREPVADVLFLHGHADRLDNHRELFLELANAGLRVISFDLPSHGETDAGPIDSWSFADLAALAGRVEHSTRNGDRPLVLAGWSFGGLLATRIAQVPEYSGELSRPLSALVLENPAVEPLALSGGDGVSKLRALTHDLDAPVAGPPSPASPFLDPVFAVRLLAQAAIARSNPLPQGPPTLVLLSDPAQDQYVDPRGIAAWANGVARADGARVTVTSCTGARHGTDFEAWPIGAGARSDIVDFLTGAVGADRSNPNPEVRTACE